MKWFYKSSILLILIFILFLLPTPISFELSALISTAFEKGCQYYCIFQSPNNSFTNNSSCHLDTNRLRNKIKKGLPQWATSQIANDLRHFDSIYKQLLHQYLNQYSNARHELVILKVQDKKVSVIQKKINLNAPHQNFLSSLPTRLIHYFYSDYEFDPRLTPILYALRYLAKVQLIPNTEVLLCLNDAVPIVSQIPLPIMAFARDNQDFFERHLILLPDWMNFRSITNLQRRIKQQTTQISWREKQPVLFWRGGTFDSSGFRQQLVKMSEKFPDRINAAFVGLNYGHFITPEDHLRYRYLLSIDGVRGSWERMVWQLHANSLIFKHDSTQVQWFYSGIQPGKHYLPFKDSKGLLSQFDWALMQSGDAQQIIKNANFFAEENLTLEDLYHYLMVLIHQYSLKLID